MTTRIISHGIEAVELYRWAVAAYWSLRIQTQGGAVVLEMLDRADLEKIRDQINKTLEPEVAP